MNHKSLSLVFLSILVCSVLLTYHHTLNSPFVFDDISNITLNPYIRINSLDIDALKHVFSSLQPSANRPVANLSFALNYLADGYNPVGYHGVNIFIHIITSLLIFYLFRWYLTKTKFSGRESLWLAFFSALIWAVNPIQTNAVTYTVQRMTSLSALFIVASLWSYIKARDLYIHYGMKERKSGVVLLAISALCCWILALLTKEIAAILPVLIVLHELVFFQGNFSWKTSLNIKNKGKYLGALVIILLLCLMYVGTDFITVILEGYDAREFTLTERLLTEPRVVIRYMTLFLVPLASRFTLHYDFPLSHSLVEPLTTFASITLLLLLFIGSLIALPKYKILSFGMLWTLLCLVMESTIIPLEIIYEHRFYLPSIGFSLLIVVFSYQMAQFFLAQRDRVFIILAMFVFFSATQTYRRNSIWADELLFSIDSVNKTPGNVRVYLPLARYYFNKHNFKSGLQTLNRAYAIDPESIDVLAFLFTVYSDQNMKNKYEPYYGQMVQSINGGNFVCSQSIFIDQVARIMFQRGRHPDVVFLLETLKKCRIKPAVYYANLGESYLQSGNKEKAIEHYSKAAELAADNSYYWYVLTQLYILVNDSENAAAAFAKLMNSSPSAEFTPGLEILKQDLDELLQKRKS